MQDLLPGGISIGICTFRRNSLACTLGSMARLRGHFTEILIVDNDKTDRARTRIMMAAAQEGLAIRYIHAPSQNISVARNAVLDHCATRWAALIDDDETARPDWLVRLAENATDAHAVIGVSNAVYGENLPVWAQKCDFHSNRLGKNLANAYTSNALLNIEFVNDVGLRFDPALGKTGGEDTIFFHQLSQRGGRIVSQPSAIVDEDVPANRATMRWVLRRAYRSGQTHARLLELTDRNRFRRLTFVAAAKLVVCGVMTVLTLATPPTWRRWSSRGALHAGAMSYTLHPRILEEYG